MTNGTRHDVAMQAVELELAAHQLVLEHIAGLLLGFSDEAWATAVKESLLRSASSLKDYRGAPIDVEYLKAWHTILTGRVAQIVERIEVVERSVRVQRDQPLRR